MIEVKKKQYIPIYVVGDLVIVKKTKSIGTITKILSSKDMPGQYYLLPGIYCEVDLIGLIHQDELRKAKKPKKVKKSKRVDKIDIPSWFKV